MVDRLARCGQRSVTALVDISNYVMFEFGRPSHIFDYDKIHGGLDVRWGRPGEQLKLLNGNTVDGRREGRRDRRRPRGRVAGRHHGRRRHRRVRRHAQRLRRGRLLVARGHPGPLAPLQLLDRRRAIASSAASTRASTVEHIEHITRLILEICGGEAGPMDDQIAASCRSASRSACAWRAPPRVIGMPLTEAQCVDALSPPAACRRRPASGMLTVTPPPYRFDLTIEEDLIEEVVRIVGYNHLPTTPPLAPITAKLPPEVAAQPLRGAPPARPRWATRKPSTSASSRSAGSASSPATPTRSSCSTRSPAR